jgi:hypothetical protein
MMKLLIPNPFRSRRPETPAAAASVTNVPGRTIASDAARAAGSLTARDELWPRRRDERPIARPQVLRFAPLAWLKLRTFLHADDVEVGGFGISAADDDLLYVEDFVAPSQHVSSVTVAFDDDAVAVHVDRYVDAGVPPRRSGRLWIHTHPCDSAAPSATDEETFRRAFGACDWAAMVIVARGGATYARLSFNAGPGGRVVIPLEVDWDRLPDDLLLHEGRLDELVSGWLDEYGRNVHPRRDAEVPAGACDDGLLFPELTTALDWRSLPDPEDASVREEVSL